jgi:hypothetical protein
MSNIQDVKFLNFAIDQIKQVLPDIDLQITPDFKIESKTRGTTLWFENGPLGFTWNSIGKSGIKSSGSSSRSFVMAFF